MKVTDLHGVSDSAVAQEIMTAVLCVYTGPPGNHPAAVAMWAQQVQGRTLRLELRYNFGDCALYLLRHQKGNGESTAGIL